MMIDRGLARKEKPHRVRAGLSQGRLSYEQLQHAPGAEGGQSGIHAISSLSARDAERILTGTGRF